MVQTLCQLELFFPVILLWCHGPFHCTHCAWDKYLWTYISAQHVSIRGVHTNTQAILSELVSGQVKYRRRLYIRGAGSIFHRLLGQPTAYCCACSRHEGRLARVGVTFIRDHLSPCKFDAAHLKALYHMSAVYPFFKEHMNMVKNIPSASDFFFGMSTSKVSTDNCKTVFPMGQWKTR